MAEANMPHYILKVETTGGVLNSLSNSNHGKECYYSGIVHAMPCGMD